MAASSDPRRISYTSPGLPPCRLGIILNAKWNQQYLEKKDFTLVDLTVFRSDGKYHEPLPIGLRGHGIDGGGDALFFKEGNRIISDHEDPLTDLIKGALSAHIFTFDFPSRLEYGKHNNNIFSNLKKLGMSIDIKKMTIQEKLIAMELFWDDICKDINGLPSPPWHGSILREREKNVAEGKDKFIDWDQAKKDIWNVIS